MRISDALLFNDLTDNLDRINRDLARRNREVASGKRLHEPSQDPSASARVVRIRDEVAQINQYERNLQRSRVLLGSSDEALNSLRNILDSAVTRTSFAISAIVDQGQRDIIAGEIDQIREQVLRLANTVVDGQFIFSGTQTDAQPFQVNPGPAFVYQGDTQRLQVEIAKGRQIETSVTGDEVFAAAGTDLLNSLVTLAGALRAGNLDAAQAQITNLSDAGRDVDQARVVIGQSLRSLEATQAEHDRTLVALTEEISSLEDADFVEAISSLGSAEGRLQAALQVAARQRTSLFDLIG